MPTHEEAEQFWRDWARLTPEQRRRFRDAVRKFSEDLEGDPPRFRRGLRVKAMQGAAGIFEMTWEIADGRATFQLGRERSPGVPHVIWRRVGGHDIFGDP